MTDPLAHIFELAAELSIEQREERIDRPVDTVERERAETRLHARQPPERRCVLEPNERGGNTSQRGA